MPSPMRTKPIANQPKTPAEIIASSVRRESERLELDFESESAGFITRGKIRVVTSDRRSRLSNVHAFQGLEGGQDLVGRS